jgi:uncharacterized alkaline shock family protein YloU
MTTQTTQPRKKENRPRTTENPSGIAGKINLSDDVVATIAGLAAADIEGIHSLGKSRWIPFGDSPSRGVDVEVGNLEAAIDVDVIIEYGCDLQAVCQTLRERLASEVKKMADREVVEVNVNVVDVKLPEPREPAEPSHSRVR